MTVDQDTIHKIAHLSRLYFDKAHEEKMLKSLNDIVDWMTKLQEVDTEGVEPLTHMTAESNIWRKDQVKEVLPHKEGLKNAPNKDSSYFRVPKVLEDKS